MVAVAICDKDVRAGGSPLLESELFFPHFTLVEAQYPQGAAASIGGWLFPVRKTNYRAGVVADVEFGLSGVSFTLGPGVTSTPDTNVERIWSFGIQAAVHRT